MNFENLVNTLPAQRDSLALSAARAAAEAANTLVVMPEQPRRWEAILLRNRAAMALQGVR